MLQEIITYTNIKLANVRPHRDKTLSCQTETDVLEIKAYFGFIIIIIIHFRVKPGINELFSHICQVDSSSILHCHYLHT